MLKGAVSCGDAAGREPGAAAGRRAGRAAESGASGASRAARRVVLNTFLQRVRWPDVQERAHMALTPEQVWLFRVAGFVKLPEILPRETVDALKEAIRR